MSLTTLKNNLITVAIASKGAEMQSILDKDGNERLWQGDAKYWTGRAPMMFPICGGLKDDIYYLDGVKYEMPKHGYVRQLEWTVESAETDKAVFLMTEKHPGFPFEYKLRATYELVGSSVKITYTMLNKDTRSYYFSIGSHEAYATPGGLEAYTVQFEQPETLANYTLAGNLLNKEPVIMGENATELPLKTEYFAVDALVFPTLKSRSVTLVNSVNDRKIKVDYEGMSTFMLWTKPGAEYICLEPWCNCPDFVDSDQQIEHKPGMMCIQPGETVVKTHTIHIL